MGPENGETIHLTGPKTSQDKNASTENGSPTGVSLDVTEMSKSNAIQHGTGKGLTVFTGVVFMFGEMAGTGILSLPFAMDGLGYMGVIILPVFGAISAYSGMKLSECWLIVQDRYPSLRQNVRYPYPAIGEIAFGRKGRIFVSAVIDVNLLGTVIVLLILCSDNVHSLLDHLLGVQIPFCLLLIIVAAILCPLTWFGSPKDFWPVAVGATLSTLLACVFVVLAMVLEDTSLDSGQVVKHSNPSVLQFFAALGTVSFAFGGHCAFPTFQNDMKEKSKFTKAVCWAFVGLTLVYMPPAVTGYFLYGKDVMPNVLDTLPASPLVQVVQILMTCHLLLASVIIINPVLQEVEELLQIPPHFNWRRAVSRSMIVAFVLFMALTVPQFGAILSFFGGSAFIIMDYVCPCVFYLKLCAMEGPWTKISVPLHSKVLLLETSIVACILGAIITYSAFFELITPDAFSLPCYISFR